MFASGVPWFVVVFCASVLSGLGLALVVVLLLLSCCYYFVTDGYLYLITWLLLPRPVLQLAWSDIAQIRVASPVRAIVYFKSHTKVELTVPWQSSYEAYVPKTVGYKKDTSYRYKN